LALREAGFEIKALPLIYPEHAFAGRNG